MNLQVIEPIEKPLKTFSTIDEFNLYYVKNKEEMDKCTTHKLNRQFHIDGYHITKIKGVLSLKKWDESHKYYKSKKDVEQSNTNDKLAELELKVESSVGEIESMNEKLIGLQESIGLIKTRINEIIGLVSQFMPN
jgi:peptidoglycan hydrolase CwlO-like protein